MPARLRRRAPVLLVFLAVAAGLFLLGSAAERLAIAVIHGVGTRNGLPGAVISGLAVIAVCVETFRYVSLRAGPAAARQPHQRCALMAGPGYGAMSVFRGVITASDRRADAEPVAK